MQTATFHGASDDLIHVTGITGGDEFYAESRHDPIMAAFSIGKVLRVWAIYTDPGVWCFAVAQYDESVPVPDWPMRIGQSPLCEYSAELQIDVPDGLRLKREKLDDLL